MSVPTRSGAPIDPRIRRRRVQVTRAKGRRRLRVLAAVVVVALVGVAAFGLARSPLLGVDDLVVVGAEQADEEEIRAASGIEIGAPILFADLSSAARRIEELPWIATARVKRDLPHTIAITVTERSPVAWSVGADGATVLVDGSARALAIVDVVPALPEITGLEGSTLEPGVVVEPKALPGVLVELPEELRARVSVVERVDEGGEVGAVLRLTEGPEIRLGALERIAEKGSAALAVLAALGDEDATYLDVKVPSAPVTG